MHKLLTAAMGLLTAFALCDPGYAATRTLNYQGRLTNSTGRAVTGSRDITFRIYDAPSGGLKKWEESHNAVAISSGLFSAALGNITSLDSLPFDSDYYIEIAVEGEILAPRQPIAGAGYAFNSEKLDGMDSSAFANIAGANATGTWPISITGTSAGAPPTGAAGGHLTGNYPTPTIAFLPAISGANLTSLTAASISAGSLGPNIIASSIAVNGVYPAALQAGTYGINITGTSVGAPPTGAAGGNLSGTYPNPSIISLPAISGANLTNLTAASISAGSLGLNVIASSIAVNGVYPAAVQAGTYGINITGTSVGAPPTGAAGGNLTGTYPNPSIASLPAISGANLTSLTATNISAGSLGPNVIASSIVVNGVYPAAVQAGTYGINITGTSAGAAPTGTAGGVLSGTYPNPGLAAGQTATVTWSGAQIFTSSANFPGSGIWTASGRVGVGTINPRSAFEVAGLIYVDTGNYSTAMGVQAGNVNSGTYNNFLGYKAGWSNSSGGNNNLFGYQAGYTNTTGHDNNFLGNAAGYANLTGHNNNFIGSVAGQNNITGVYNNFIGGSAGWSNTGGGYNNFLGANAGNYNTTGGNNNLVGYNAGFYNQAGSSNTIIGDNAGYGSSGQSHSGNTLAGYKSGYGLSTGSRNLLLGWQAGDSLTTGSDNIIIGYNADAPSASTSSFLNIGNVIYGNLSSGNVGIGTTSSLGINPMGKKLSVVSGQPTGGGISLQNTDISSWSSLEVYDYQGTQKANFGYANPNAATVPGLAHVSTSDDTPLVIAIHDTERVRFTKDGDVGIGTTTPTHKLHVAGNAIVTSSMSVSGSGLSGAMPVFQVVNGTMTVLANGNVGIGTASPAAKLDVAGNISAQRYNKVTIPSAYTSAAIQAAINTVVAEGGGIVYLPAGTYAVNATITINGANVTLQGTGGGTILDGTGFAGGTMIQTSGYGTTTFWHIKDLTIKGSNTTGGSASDAGTGLYMGGGTTNGKISHVRFTNLYTYCINNSFSNDGEISYCTFDGYTGAAIHTSNTYRQRITGCHFSGDYATYGIQAEANWFSGNIIANNVFEYSGTGITVAIYIPAGTTVSDNVISNNRFSLYAANSASTVYGINTGGTNTNIVGNRLVVTNAGSGGGIGINSTGDYCNISANNSKGSKTADSISGTGTETGGANISGP